MKVRTALVGINGYAQVHLNQLKPLAESGGIELSAAVVLPRERTPENMAYFESAGCEVFDSLDEMFGHCARKPELVCLPTGISSHEPLTKCCLEHGANVLVEKPAAGSLEAVDRMRRAEAESDCFVAVGFQHIHSREFRKIKKDLLSGRLGRLKAIAVMGIWPRADAYYSRNNWAGRIRTASGEQVLDSPANNAFAHYLNLPLFFAGETFERSAHPVWIEGQLYRARKSIEYFDTCGIRLKTAGGTAVCAYFSHASNTVRNPVIRIQCEAGSVLIDFNTGRWGMSDGAGAVLDEGEISVPHPDMFRDVLAKVSDRSVFTCTLDIAREHTFCIEELHRHCIPQDVPEHLLSVEAENGQVVIRGLEHTFDECFESGGKLVF